MVWLAEVARPFRRGEAREQRGLMWISAGTVIGGVFFRNSRTMATEVHL